MQGNCFYVYNITMQKNKIDENQLIVSWNRYEQSLMKAHLMRCIGDNIYCFGDQKEVIKLHYMLAKHGVLQPRNYKTPDFQQLVSDIKLVIQANLKNIVEQNF